MVLHTLLIHGGLWSRVLPELLPLTPVEIREYLYLLEASGLVESDQGFWRVTPTGYPAVRQLLQSEGYLTDAI
jgi:DNA-binding GntR family transcriptional regulator